MREQEEPGSRAVAARPSSLARDLALYTAIRLGMIVAGTAVLIGFQVPLLVAAAVAVVLSMAVSALVLPGLRQRVATGMAQRSARRRAQRERLRRELRADRDTGES